MCMSRRGFPSSRLCLFNFLYILGLMKNACHQSLPKNLSQVAQNLNYQPEILLEENRDASCLRKGWVENSMCYTGVGHLSGVLGGGLKGVINGVKAAKSGDSLKI